MHCWVPFRGSRRRRGDCPRLLGALEHEQGPADLNLIEGKYGISPALPAVPGIEGVGVVEGVGANTSGFSVGDHVLLPHGYGSWREAGIVGSLSWSLVITAIAAVVGFFILRRATPRG